MIFLLTLLACRIIVFANTLYYTISLLLIAVVVLFWLTSFGFLSSLTIVIICIVYLGAIIILIGYVCAVSPNIKLVSYHSFFTYFLLISLPVQSLVSSTTFSFTGLKFSIVEYFYCSSGMLSFFTLIFMLFITLLIVTSQYVTPRGPFRSSI